MYWGLIVPQSLNLVASLIRHLPYYNLKSHTKENFHELDQGVIGIWKYVRMGILVYLKNQVENHSKIDNSVNNQKSKTYKSNFSKAWKENRDNMLC